MKKQTKKLQIGGKTYDLIYCDFKKNSGSVFDTLDQCRGYCDTDGLEIHVDINIKPNYIAATTIHEVLHAIHSEYHLKYDNHDLEEEVVTTLTNGLMAAFKANPYLLETIKDGLDLK